MGQVCPGFATASCWFTSNKAASELLRDCTVGGAVGGEETGSVCGCWGCCEAAKIEKLILMTSTSINQMQINLEEQSDEWMDGDWDPANCLVVVLATFLW
jgi:hypothetical protein